MVDTVTLEGQGFAVEQVAGACFCCHFDALTRSAAALEARSQPQVILAEPVGSCTDLVATVIRPLTKLYGDNFTLALLASCSSRSAPGSPWMRMPGPCNLTRSISSGNNWKKPTTSR